MVETRSRVRVIGPQEYGVISHFDLNCVDCLVTTELVDPWFAVSFSSKIPGEPEALLAVLNRKIYTHNLSLLMEELANLRQGYNPIDMSLLVPYASEVPDYASEVPGLLGEGIGKFNTSVGKQNRPLHGVLRLDRGLSVFTFNKNERKDTQQAIKGPYSDSDYRDLVLRRVYTPFIGATVYNGGKWPTSKIS